MGLELDGLVLQLIRHVETVEARIFLGLQAPLPLAKKLHPVTVENLLLLGGLLALDQLQVPKFVVELDFYLGPLEIGVILLLLLDASHRDQIRSLVLGVSRQRLILDMGDAVQGVFG